MSEVPLRLRHRIVQAYLSGQTRTYEATAEMFGVGRATVSRLLRRYREDGVVDCKPRGGNNPRRVDLDWLRRHAEQNPDARLIDRADAWELENGRRVSISAISDALSAIGWTHKKKRRLPAKGTDRTSRKNANRSSNNNRNLKRQS
jgi:transposase